jgi:hypothetical protein
MPLKILVSIFGAFLAASASAQVVSGGGPSGFLTLFTNGASSGNGADLTEDTLTTCSSYTLPAGQLANVGDVIRIFAGGTLGASTDSKTVRVKIGSSTVGIIISAAVGGTQWSSDIYIMKTGSNTQSSGGYTMANNQGVGISSFALTFTDTATQLISVTGQNATNSVAGSVTCRMAIVQYLH